MSTVAIIGTSPAGLHAPVRVRRFADFKRLVVDIESLAPGSCPAAHAACHALMNGVEVITFAPVASVDEPSLVREAASKLARDPSISLVVAPGVVETEVVDALVSALHPPRGVWLDAPRDADLSDIVALQSTLGKRGYVVMPWVATMSPGSRMMERLPASCLVAPLVMGSATFLKGVHEPPPALDLATQERLRSAGVCWLFASGMRRQITWSGYGAPPASASPEGPRPASSELVDALQRAGEEAIREGQTGPRLWKSLERRVTATLMAMRARGEVGDFHVRCDAETNEGSGGAPVVEVILEPRTPTPRRLELRLSRF